MSQISDGARRKWLRFKYGIITLALISWAVLAVPANAMAAGTGQQASFTLDGVRLAVTTNFLPGAGFATSQPGDAQQVASSAAFLPFQELAVVAVPFQTRSPAEGLPTAASGGAPTYLSQLATYRRSQGGKTISAPVISIFGHAVAGVMSTTPIRVSPQQPSSTAIAEWVAEAGGRLWIVRASKELAATESQWSFATLLVGLTVTASSPLGRTTVSTSVPAQRTAAPAAPPTRGTSLSELQSGAKIGLTPTAPIAPAPQATSDFPSWWNGNCDVGNHPGSFPLGASYNGMPACGPRPIAGAADVTVYFFPGAWPELEWECVELSMRYLYLTYGQAPYGANGKDVVANYPGSQLTKVANGSIGSAPAPGDVLSYGPTTQFGHTSVVSAGTVDGNGNGSITVVEQNNSSGGSTTMSVGGWTVQGSPYAVSGWLHNPASAVAAASMNSGQMDVFVKSSGNQIVYEYWTGSAWNGTWLSIGAPSVGILGGTGPAAVSMNYGTVDVFVVGADRSVYYNYWSDTVGAWSGWLQVPNSCCAADTPAAASMHFGQLDLFVRDQNNRIWYQYWTGSAWNGSWLDLGMPAGGALSAPAAASMVPCGECVGGEITVFAQGSSGQLMERYWYDSIGAWSEWVQVPNSSGLSGAPAAVSMHAAQMDVFGRDAGAAPWYEYWNGSVWSSTLSLGGTFQSPPAAASMNPGQLDVFFVDHSQVSYRYWTDAGGWSTYVAIPQFVP